MAEAPTRDAVLAEIAALPSEEAAPVAAVEEAPAEVEAEETASQDEAVEADAEDTDAIEAASDEDAAIDDDADDADLTSADPETQKRLDAVRVAEKRMRAAAARRDAEFTAKQAEWQSKVDRVAELDKLFSRAKYDPASLLRAAGVTDDDFEDVAKAIYAESPALQKDPKQKAAAQARLREREKEDKLTAAERRIAEVEAKLEQQKTDAAAAQEAQAYIGQINTAASSKHPLVAHLLKADPNDTHDALVKTYNALGSKLQRTPKAIEVVAAFDKAQRAKLARLGIDPATLIKTPAKRPVVVANASAAKPAPAKPVNGEAKKTPTREDILAEISALPS